MDMFEAIRERKMFRGSFQDKAVDRSIVVQMVDAARWAPSGHNSQPWQFLAVDDRRMIAELMDIVVKRVNEVQRTRQDLKKLVEVWYSWTRWSPEALEAAGDGMYMNTMSQQTWEKMIHTASDEELRSYVLDVLSPDARAAQVKASPCLLFTLLDGSVEIPNFSQEVMALTAVGGAIQNIRLVAHALGLGAHEISLFWDTVQAAAAVRQHLGIPERFRIVSAMRIGYPADPTPTHTTHVRKAAEDLLHWNSF